MTKSATLFTAFLLVAGALVQGAAGCELLAKVDTNLIGGGGSTGSCEAGVACTGPADCKFSSPTTCVVSTCMGGCCGSANAGDTASCSDNGGRICDGKGKCVGCNQPSDCPATGTTCKTNTCDPTAHTCGGTDAGKGMPCSDHGGTVCDGMGSCVAAHCTDGSKDADETDVDCGGSCPPCGDTKGCKVAADCTSKICDGTMHCAVPTCSDNVQNGDETDKDCGGGSYMGAQPCPKCADKLHCAMNSDCANGDCFGSSPGTCVSCMDSTKDGNETDVDCGGATCDTAGKLCAVGQHCGINADCTTNLCMSGTCAKQPDGQPCMGDTDCTNGHCIAGAGGSGKICCHTGCMNQGADSCGDDGKCLANGSGCELYPSGTACGAACSMGTQTAAGTCNGTGMCNPGAMSACTPYVCGATACKTSCTSPSDCATNNTCSSSNTCLLAGGQGCSGNGQCASGSCFGGMFCCTATCNTMGTCGATHCDNTGACVGPDNTTACGGTCVDNPGSASMGTAGGNCDGMGNCSAQPMSCGLYKCNGMACGTTCATDNDCITGHTCCLTGSCMHNKCM